MDASEPNLPEAIAARALARLRGGDAGNTTGDVPDARAALAPRAAEAVSRLAVASDFAIDTLVAQPGLLPRFLEDASDPLVLPPLSCDAPDAWPGILRRHRQAESARLAWRDIVEAADVDEILAGSTRLAEDCLRAALVAVGTAFEARHGVVRASDGSVQRLVVLAMGKLGGGELNFSSDVDLVYAYEHEGMSDGGRPLHAQDYFARLGQQLARLLDEVTADGFCHRVDLRLRPFGSAGRLVLSFTAMEAYFQREGRDWERYAWQKARPVAGDLEAGERLLETLRPFVYRRYLDYGALDGLRAMKALITAEVARKDLAGDIKRGPGGIREIEFLAQALQLIRGGREPALRQRGLQAALSALANAGHLPTATAEALARAYRFLRRLENRLQMLGDAQVHALPDSDAVRSRLAAGLEYADWSALEEALSRQRGVVCEEFAALLAPPAAPAPAPDRLATYWRSLPGSDGDASLLASAGFAGAAAIDAQLVEFARSPGVQALSDASRARLDRLLPQLLQRAAAGDAPDRVLQRVLPLLQTILRRASYLALLDEQPAALERLATTLSRSALLGERLAAFPLLLDELLDVRVGQELPHGDAMRRQCEDAVRGLEVEPALDALNEVRQALSFRFALALLDGRIDACDCAARLSALADAVVHALLRLARAAVVEQHGDVPSGRFAILGYGTLGGCELGFGSDLDLVFLYDAPDGAQSDGPRPLDAARWFARLGQKVVSLLAVRTPAGRLFDVDMRLRPDGAKGLLVSRLAGFADYQLHRAWTWEHQALVRARGVAGDGALLAAFEGIRRQVLARPRDVPTLSADVAGMRTRMRQELDRSDAHAFDIKQGDGGLVDLEFLLQFLVLRDAHAVPMLAEGRSTPTLLRAAIAAGSLDADAGVRLLDAHACLLEAGMRCTLDRRPRRVAPSAAVASASATIRAAFADIGRLSAGPVAQDAPSGFTKRTELAP